MRKHEIEQLERLHSIIGQIPRPAMGSQSSSAEGYLAYAVDLETVIPWIRKAIQGVALQGRQDLFVGIDYKDPNRVLDLLQRWIDARKSADWKLPVPKIEDFVQA